MDWQSTRVSIQEANEHLLSSGIFSDVTFVIGSEPREEVKAHKFILMTRSAVFEVMFQRWETAQDCQVEIPEIRSTSFRAFLSYLYANKVPELQPTEIVELLYLAHKYGVKSVATAASEMLRRDVTAGNVITLYQLARTLDQTDLQKDTLKYMCRNARSVFERPEFLNIDEETLVTLLNSDKLCVEEIVVFKAVVGWAEHQCEAKELPSTGQNKRMILYSILPLIRFPRMNSQCFTEEVISKHPGLLTESEAIELFVYFNAGPVVRPTLPPLSFISSDRDPGNTYRIMPYNREQTCSYFVSTPDKPVPKKVLREESLLFSTNTDVYISGLELYGPIYRGTDDEGRRTRLPLNVRIYLMDFHGVQVGYGVDRVFVKPLETFTVDYEASVKVITKSAFYAVVYIEGPETCTGLYLSSKREVPTYQGKVRFKLWSKRLDWKSLIPSNPLSGESTERCSGKIKSILFKV